MSYPNPHSRPGPVPPLQLDPVSNRWYYIDEHTSERVYTEPRGVFGSPQEIPSAEHFRRFSHGANANYQPTLPTLISSSGHPSASPAPNLEILAQNLRNASINHPNTLSPAPVNWAQPNYRPPPSFEPSTQSRNLPPVTTQNSLQDGIAVVYRRNHTNGVQTKFGERPAERITDPGLFRNKVRAVRVLLPTDGQQETLFVNYRVRPSSFFSFGRVFLVLWAEPAGETSMVTSVVAATPEQLPGRQSGISQGQYGERVFSKVRRFVVIRENTSFCTALPIISYGGRGVGKPGVKKSEHAIIYTGARAPSPRPAETAQRGENPMRPNAIRVVGDSGETLNPMSRLDFGKPHTVQHNLKVCPMGTVHPHSLGELRAQFQNVWGVSPNVDAETAGPSQQQRWQGHRSRPAEHPDEALAQARARADYVERLVARGWSRQEACTVLAQSIMTSNGFTLEQANEMIRRQILYSQTHGLADAAANDGSEGGGEEEEEEEDEEEDVDVDEDEDEDKDDNDEDEVDDNDAEGGDGEE